MTLPNMNLSQARTGSIDSGGYVVKVVNTNIDTQYNRLQLLVDIAEGDKRGYYSDLDGKYGFWGLTANLSLEPENAWKFANAIDAFRASNEGFVWNDDGENDERSLIGMCCGVITQKKHYIGNDGRKKSKLQVYRIIPAEDIRSGNYEVPDDLYANGLSAAPASPAAGVVDTTAGPVEGFGPLNDDDIPFA